MDGQPRRFLTVAGDLGMNHDPAEDLHEFLLGLEVQPSVQP
jgi:hypothetical protein